MQHDVYYNEHDLHAAQWLKNLGDAELIWPGSVDSRDIQEVAADDVRGFHECHFFAGIGGWSLALELAGWPRERSVWTGSCPCQPYSEAGKRKGNADERNLWPDFFQLIRQCRPDTIFGEQVESAIRHGWLDGISSDLEGEGYAVGSAVLGAHSVGSPNIRQRLYWVAYRDGQRFPIRPEPICIKEQSQEQASRRLDVGGRGGSDWLGDASRSRLAGWSGEPGHDETQLAAVERASSNVDFWSRFDLIPCLDGKTRRVEPGSQCLVDGVSFRLADGRSREDVSRKAILNGFGNAIVPGLAAEFIRAFLDVSEV